MFRAVRAARVAIDRDGLPHLAAEQLVNGDAEGLALYIPQGHVDGADGAAANRAGDAVPVEHVVELVPEVFDSVWIFAD